jgi:hypothetical protein
MLDEKGGAQLFARFLVRFRQASRGENGGLRNFLCRFAHVKHRNGERRGTKVIVIDRPLREAEGQE